MLSPEISQARARTEGGIMRKHSPGLLGVIFLPLALCRPEHHFSNRHQLESLQESLDVIYQEHLHTKMTRLKAEEIPQLRQRRNSQFPKITRKKKKVRTCQNMAGIIGEFIGGGGECFNVKLFSDLQEERMPSTSSISWLQW